MIREMRAFTIKLAGFSLILFLVHYYILSQFFSGELYFPLWTIYCFHAILVFVMYAALRYYVAKNTNIIFKLFLGLTLLKMILAIVFLLPLFLGKSTHTQLEVINFFIPYFFLVIKRIGFFSDIRAINNASMCYFICRRT